MRRMREVDGGGDEESTTDKKTRERQQHGPEHQVVYEFREVQV